MNTPTPMPLFVILWITFLVVTFLESKATSDQSKQIEKIQEEIKEMKAPKTFLLPDEQIDNPGHEN